MPNNNTQQIPAKLQEQINGVKNLKLDANIEADMIKRLYKGFGLNVPIANFEAFDYTVESGTNKGKVIRLMKVANGKQPKTITFGQFKTIRDNMDEFILQGEEIFKAELAAEKK